MSKTRFVLSTSLVIALATALAGCKKDPEPPPPPPPASPYQHVTFEKGLSADEVEQQFPLTDEGRAELTPANVAKLEQWQIDQLYARLDGRAIPDGPWQGRFFFAEGSGIKEISQAFNILPERVAQRLVDLKLEELTKVGEALWKGKVFFKEEGVLRNMIDYERIIERVFDVDPAEVRKSTFEGREVALLFPAKLYCGKSLKDGRRDSVIIDYAESETIEGYIKNVDFLAAKEGLNIRDEIRFVRPGFYLGLAYFLDEKLLLAFTLENQEAAAAGAPEPECWDGRGPRPSSDSETDDTGAAG